MNKVIDTAASIIVILLLISGISIVMLAPMIIEGLTLYFPGNVIITLNSPLVVSWLPALSSTFLVLGVIGLAGQSLFNNIFNRKRRTIKKT